MTSKAKFSEDEMDYKPGEIVQRGNRYFEADVWGVLHAIKKSLIIGRNVIV